MQITNALVIIVSLLKMEIPLNLINRYGRTNAKSNFHILDISAET